MAPNPDASLTLPDEVRAWLDHHPDGSDDVGSLKTLPERFETTLETDLVEEALQLLGTAVGKQSTRR